MRVCLSFSFRARWRREIIPTDIREIAESLLPFGVYVNVVKRDTMSASDRAFRYIAISLNLRF